MYINFIVALEIINDDCYYLLVKMNIREMHIIVVAGSQILTAVNIIYERYVWRRLSTRFRRIFKTGESSV